VESQLGVGGSPGNNIIDLSWPANNIPTDHIENWALAFAPGQ
jgi:hypothetical protein